MTIYYVYQIDYRFGNWELGNGNYPTNIIYYIPMYNIYRSVGIDKII